MEPVVCLWVQRVFSIEVTDGAEVCLCQALPKDNCSFYTTPPAVPTFGFRDGSLDGGRQGRTVDLAFELFAVEPVLVQDGELTD